MALVPPPTPHSIPSKTISREIIRAHEALGALKASVSILPNPDLVTRTFERREAVRSSQIEGTNSDVNELFTYEATGSDEGLTPDVRVTLNYVLALEHGLKVVRKHGAIALDCDLIKGLHKHLMRSTDYKGEPGEFRTKQNWIGEYTIYQAKFVPPPHDRVESCLEDLVNFMKDTPKEEDQYEVPIVMRMAIAHAQFETIHPFIDGNGRVGRILLPLILTAEGYPPVYIAGFLKDNQQLYYDYLAGVQLRDEWAAWVGFFATAVEESVKESISTTEGMVAILNQWKKRIAEMNLRSDSAVLRLPDLLIGTPVVSARRVKDALDISFPAASNALAKLEQAGILSIPKKRQRNRTFIATEVISLLNRPAVRRQ
jgi:Fic family protein